jgi:hypothetical protein
MAVAFAQLQRQLRKITIHAAAVRRAGPQAAGAHVMRGGRETDNRRTGATGPSCDDRPIEVILAVQPMSDGTADIQSVIRSTALD